ncbi:QRFP-like peptide receptor [Branchiostoma lanceolatum]|uniref:QRFP-like peptide receptor n=1 Tax=Branchiostoma lanceolatum TaxID=7740 RepID=UPI0034564443
MTMSEPDLPSTSLWVVTVVYCVIFVVGVSGNMLVGIVVWKNVDMRTPTNFFLVNLSIADLLLLVVSMPVALLETWIPAPWMLGRFMCLISYYNEHLVFQASILTISAIGVERYYAICHPLKAKLNLTRRRIFCSIAAIWAFSLALSSPMFTITDLIEHRLNETNGTDVIVVCITDAGSTLGKTYMTVGSILFFVVPLLLLCGLYTAISWRLCDVPSTEQGRDVRKMAQMRSRRQVIHMLVAVVVTFFVCLTPHRVFQMWILFLPEDQYQSLDQVTTMNVLVFIRVMVYLNSTLNPILYTLISSNFQSGLLAALGCREKEYPQSTASFVFSSHRRSTTAISLATLKNYPASAHSAFSRPAGRKDFIVTRQSFPAATPPTGSSRLSPSGRELMTSTPGSCRGLGVCTRTSTGSSFSSI